MRIRLAVTATFLTIATSAFFIAACSNDNNDDEDDAPLTDEEKADGTKAAAVATGSLAVGATESGSALREPANSPA